MYKHCDLPQHGDGELVVEIGCGAGGILKTFAEKGYQVKGVDLDKNYLNYGKEFHGLALEYGNIEELKLSRHPKVIIYSHVLEHILDLQDQLKKINDLSNEETLIYIEVPGIKNIHKQYKSDLLLYLQNSHVYHFSLNTLVNLFQLNGFRLKHGDEFVRSVFCKSNTSELMYDEYNNIRKYLERIARYRIFNPFTPRNIILMAKRIINKLTLLSGKTGH